LKIASDCLKIASAADKFISDELDTQPVITLRLVYSDESKLAVMLRSISPFLKLPHGYAEGPTVFTEANARLVSFAGLYAFISRQQSFGVMAIASSHGRGG
jgi:hypothetical protein